MQNEHCFETITVILNQKRGSSTSPILQSQYQCKTNIALNAINQENMGYTSKWNKVKEQILNIGNEICGNKKLEHKQQWMTEEILENMEQRKEQQDKDIARYKLLYGEIRH